jgi:hypothetical protein
VIPFDHIQKILVEKIEPLTRSAKAKPYQISIVLNNGKTLALDQEFQTADLEEKLKLLKYFITDAYSGDAAQSAEVERSYMSKATILDETDLASEINPSANDSELFKLDHHSSDFEQQLEWTPLRTDYSRSNGFKCHQLNDDQMLIQIEPSTQGQGVIYLLISVAVFFLGLATSLGGVYFFAFLGFIAAMLALFNRGEFYLADKSSGCLTPVNSKPSSNAFPKHAISGREQIDLSDIQCLQVLTYTATLSATKGTQYAAVDEINLVLKSSDRINLTREQSKPELITEAERLGRFLQLPVYYQNHA